jgi:hypothetical protein
MRRRKYLAAVGSLAAGGAAMMGTGAFSTVEAERTMTVDTASDAGALLGIEAGPGPNGQYVSPDGSAADVVEIDLDTAEADGFYGGGVNAKAVSEFDKLLLITNQGTQGCEIQVEKTDSGGGGDNSGDVEFYATGYDGSYPSDLYDESNSQVKRLDESGEGFDLAVGQAALVSVRVDTDIGPSSDLLDKITIKAVTGPEYSGSDV